MMDTADKWTNEHVFGRLLVVDDEFEIRSMLGRYLQGTGYRVLVAEDGIQALELLKRHPIDVMLADMTMPRMSGNVLLQEVKENYPSCRVLVMTGRLCEDNLVKAMRHGADGCLLKPLVDLSLLDQALDRALRIRAAWQTALSQVRGRARQLQIEPLAPRDKHRLG